MQQICGQTVMILWAIREGSQNSVDVIHESPLTATLIIVIIVVEGAFTKLNWLKTTSTEARELYMHFIRVLPYPCFVCLSGFQPKSAEFQYHLRRAKQWISQKA